MTHFNPYPKNKQLKKKPKDKKIPFSQRKNIRCFVCGGACEHLHHIKLYSSDKKDHSKLLPLCKSHHDGNELSPHGTAKKWRDMFTIEEQIEASREMFKVLESIRGNCA